MRVEVYRGEEGDDQILVVDFDVVPRIGACLSVDAGGYFDESGFRSGCARSTALVS
jgi:hypothetical protein